MHNVWALIYAHPVLPSIFAVLLFSGAVAHMPELPPMPPGWGSWLATWIFSTLKWLGAAGTSIVSRLPQYQKLQQLTETAPDGSKVVSTTLQNSALIPKA